jgi:predicted DNA-binding protein
MNQKVGGMKAKTKTIGVRVSGQEKKRINKLAAHHECSVSYLIRMLLYRAANELENRS